MANNKVNLIKNIETFLLAANEKCMFITGTNQYRKHIVTIAALDRLAPGSHVLFRSSVMKNLLDREFLGRFISRQPQIGEKYRIGNNIYESDTFTNSSSWFKTDSRLDFAIFYPIDAIARRNVNIKCIDNLFFEKKIDKVFLISWTDLNYDYSIFDKYVDRRCTYDAEEEDIEYHKRVLELIEDREK